MLEVDIASLRHFETRFGRRNTRWCGAIARPTTRRLTSRVCLTKVGDTSEVALCLQENLLLWEIALDLELHFNPSPLPPGIDFKSLGLPERLLTPRINSAMSCKVHEEHRFRRPTHLSLSPLVAQLMTSCN